LDTGAASGRYDLNYLMRNIEGGEGYDWYYVNPDDRLLQERTTIVDTAYGKDWVFRYKDMRNWWRHRHYTRLGGVETGPTAWQAQSKPIWLMEIGCPAVDKGANQPNVFFDPKSDESHLPYFSNGARDDTIQRLYLQAVLRYWSGAENPISEIYNAPMIDMESSHIWCWDARVVYDLSLRADIKSADVSKITGVIEGYSLDRPMSPRAAIEPLSLAYGFDMAETATGLRFIPQTGATTKTISLSDMGADIPSETKEDRESLLKDVRLHYIDAGRDYQSAVISAKDLSAESVQIVDIPTPIAMDAALAKSMASRILLRSQTSDRQINFTLSPNALDVNVGDVVILPNIEGAWQVEIISEDGLRSVSAKFHDNDLPLLDFDRSVPAVDNPPIWWPKPSPLIVDVPKLGSAVRSGPLIGASARPFAPVLFAQGQSQAQSLRPIYRGELLTPLTSGPVGRWDRAAQFEMSMPYLKLASVSEADLLSGANQFAVKTETGWEVMAAQTIVLEEGGAYRCSNLLRGLSGSEAEIMTVIPSGTDIIWLGEGLVNLSLSNDFIDSEIRATATMAGRVSESAPVIYKAKHLRPFAPVHGKIIPTEVGVKLSWIGREQGFDDWGASSVDRHAVFRITLLGEEAETLRYEVQGYETFLADSLLHDFSEITIEQGAEDYGFGPSLRLRL